MRPHLEMEIANMARAASTESLPLGRVIAAWSVHLFTMTGAAWAVLAMVALHQGDIKMMWLWLGIANVVDAIDGSFARAANVRKYAPSFDGSILDNIIDYLTWTFIPAVFMYLYLDFGSQTMAAIAMIFIVTSSAFCYCNVGLKTDDNYFMGFPAAWNVVALIMWLVGTGATANLIITLVLGVLTLAPLAFVHPFRVRWLRPLNIAAVSAWLGLSAYLVVVAPEWPTIPALVWWASGIWLMLISAVRTFDEMRRRTRA